MSTIGSSYIDTLLGEYVPVQETNSLPEEILNDETNQLLYALLVELRAERFQRGQYDIQTALSDAGRVATGDADVDGTYVADEYDLDADEWTEIDLDYVTEQIDIRGFGSDIEVAFAKEPGGDDIVTYTSGNAPLIGIPVSTSWIQLRGASASVSGVNVEAWGDT